MRRMEKIARRRSEMHGWEGRGSGSLHLLRAASDLSRPPLGDGQDQRQQQDG